MRAETWASKEVRSVFFDSLDKKKAGPVVDRIDGNIYTLGNDDNVMYLGVTGSGKSRRGTISAIASMIRAGESFVVTDPKGEIRNATAGAAVKKGYKEITLNFRDIERSCAFNILEMPYKLYTSKNPNDKSAACDMISEIAESIFIQSSHADPFWIQSARSLFTGTTLMLFELGEAGNINIANVIHLINSGISGPRFETAFQKICKEMPNSTFAMLLSNCNAAPKETLGSILSSTFEPLMPFMRSKAVTDLLNNSEFSVTELDGKSPVAVYIVIPDENNIYDDITGIIVTQIINHFIRLAHGKFNGRLPRRVNIILEELGNIGRAIPNLPQLMSAGRSRNLRTYIVLQSLAQLRDTYGEAKATTIESNCDTVIAYRIRHLPTLEALSKQCGERIVSYGSHSAAEPLISPAQLGAMETGQALIMIEGRLKYVTCLPDYTEFLSNAESPKIKKKKRKFKEIEFFDINDYITKLISAKRPEPQEFVNFDAPIRPIPFKNIFDGSLKLTERDLLFGELTKVREILSEKLTVFKISNYDQDLIPFVNRMRITKLPLNETRPFMLVLPQRFSKEVGDRLNERYKCSIITFECNEGTKLEPVQKDSPADSSVDPDFKVDKIDTDDAIRDLDLDLLDDLDELDDLDDLDDLDGFVDPDDDLPFDF